MKWPFRRRRISEQRKPARLPVEVILRGDPPMRRVCETPLATFIEVPVYLTPDGLDPHAVVGDTPGLVLHMRRYRLVRAEYELETP